MPSSSSSSGASELASGKLLLDFPEDALARVTISNPEKRGALDHEMLDALAEVARTVEARCLLLTGSGSTFSAGYDLGNLSGEEFEQRAASLVAHPFHAAIEALEAFPYPAVAALNGHAIGGGLELALTCDVRIAARGIKVGMPPARLGLIYSHTGLRKFVEACGPAYTAELFYTARNVDADRAHEMGLLNRVVAPERLADEGLALAAEIARNAPLSLAGNKRILRTLRHHASELPGSVERELVELRESCFRSDDFREGVRAFDEKRPPVWRNR